MKSLIKLKQRAFPKGVRHSAGKISDRLFNRTTVNSLATALGELRIPDGSVVCIHSMLSGLGHIVGGPSTVLKALQKTVSDVTIMMPTFPFDGSALDFIESKSVFDPQTTPSKSGLLSETLRLSKGAVRSLHPTHPCAALGPLADVLIEGSEMSETPFGNESTYGRFSNMANATLLLIHTNNTSIVHRFQERVNMPNLFLPGIHTANAYGRDRQISSYGVRVHTPVIPLFVIMPGVSPTEHEYVWFPDYALLFPEYNRARILKKIRSDKARQILTQRDRDLRETGILRIISHKDAEIAAVQVSKWQELVCSDVTESLKQFADAYSLEKMTLVQQLGLLTKHPLPTP